MKKITGLMGMLVAAAALAVPAAAAGRECGGYATYDSYTVVRHEAPVRHEIRREVRPVRGQYERR